MADKSYSIRSKKRVITINKEGIILDNNKEVIGWDRISRCYFERGYYEHTGSAMSANSRFIIKDKCGKKIANISMKGFYGFDFMLGRAINKYSGRGCFSWFTYFFDALFELLLVLVFFGIPLFILFLVVWFISRV